MPSSAVIIPPTPIIGIFPFRHLLRCLMTFVDFLFNGAPDRPSFFHQNIWSSRYLFYQLLYWLQSLRSTLYFRSNFAIESNCLLELSGETLTTKGTNFLNFL